MVVVALVTAVAVDIGVALVVAVALVVLVIAVDAAKQNMRCMLSLLVNTSKRLLTRSASSALMVFCPKKPQSLVLNPYSNPNPWP